MRYLILIILVLALLLAACNGGGGRTEPTPTPSPAVTQLSPTPEATSTSELTPKPTATAAAETTPQLAYVGADGAIWLVNADGSGQTRFADICSGQEIYPVILAWSVDGGNLAVSCQAPGDSQPSLVVLDEAGRRLAGAEGVSVFRWSPDGRHIAYRQSGAVKVLDIVQGTDLALADESANVAAWSPDGSSFAYVGNSGDVVIWDVASREQTRLAVGIDGIAAWVLGGKKMVVTSNVRDCGIICLYDANLLALDSSELTRVPQLDDTTQFWPSPDGSRAIFLGGGGPGGGGNAMAILDFATLDVTPIEGATIGFPSHAIPSQQVAFSPDGTKFYGADASREQAVIYRVKLDGSALTKLGTVPTIFVTLSDDGLVAYPLGDPPTVVVEDLEAGTVVEVGEASRVSMAWRPAP